MVPSENSRSRISSYRDLDVWQMAMDLCLKAVETSRILPASERWSLVDQIRRSARSIPANIAEGHGRAAPREFRRFLLMANGSRTELETHLQIAQQEGYIDRATTQHLLALSASLGKKLTNLRRTLE